MPKGLRKIVCALLVAGVAGGVILAGNRPLAVPVAGVHTPSAPGAPAQDPESNKVVDFVADRGYPIPYGDTTATDRKSTRLNSSHSSQSRMPSSA